MGHLSDKYTQLRQDSIIYTYVPIYQRKSCIAAFIHFHLIMQASHIMHLLSIHFLNMRYKINGITQKLFWYLIHVKCVKMHFFCIVCKHFIGPPYSLFRWGKCIISGYEQHLVCANHGKSDGLYASFAPTKCCSYPDKKSSFEPNKCCSYPDNMHLPSIHNYYTHKFKIHDRTL